MRAAFWGTQGPPSLPDSADPVALQSAPTTSMGLASSDDGAHMEPSCCQSEEPERRPVTGRALQAWGVLLLGLAAACGDSGTGPDPGADGYTDEELSYFAEIAFGAEFGGAATPLLHRWDKNPSVRVHGTPVAADDAVITQVLGEINSLTHGVRLQRTDGTGDIDLYVVPQADFQRYDPNAIPGSRGFVWIWWDAGQQIIRARILVASDVSQDARAHVIREELTQSLGLLRDSHRYPESIFYAAASLVQSYAPIDRAVIEMLYRPELAPGMTRERALSTLRQLRRSSVSSTATVAGWVERNPSAAPGAGSAGSGVGTP
jgi:hypothetical protein